MAWGGTDRQFRFVMLVLARVRGGMAVCDLSGRFGVVIIKLHQLHPFDQLIIRSIITISLELSSC